MAIIAGQQIAADDVMNAFGKIIKNSSQAIFNQYYKGWDANLNVSGTPNYTNFAADPFITLGSSQRRTTLHIGSPTYNQSNFSGGAPTGFYVDIDADAITNTGSFGIYGCNFAQIGSNRWRLLSTGGALYGTNRARVMGVLFVGSPTPFTGSPYQFNSPRASSTYITTPTKFASPDPMDYGRRASTAIVAKIDLTNNQSGGRTLTFPASVGSIESWSSVISAAPVGRWELPAETVLNDGNTDEFYTDLTADIKVNETSAHLKMTDTGADGTGGVAAMWLMSGVTTFNALYSQAGSVTVAATKDFNVDDGMPVFSALTHPGSEYFVSNNYGGGTGSITNVIVVANTATSGTNATTSWETSNRTIEDMEAVTLNQIFRFSNSAGSNLFIKGWILTSGTNAARQSISEYATTWNLY